MFNFLDLDNALIFNAASTAMACTELESGRIVAVNDAWVQATGIPREDAADGTAFEPGQWASKGARDECMALLNRDGRVTDFEATLVLRSIELPHLISGRVVNAGGARYALWEFRNIAAQREAEALLRESEHRYGTLANNLPLAIQVFAPDGRPLRVNRRWEQMWGANLSALAQYNVFEDRQLAESGVLAQLARAFAGESVEFPVHGYDRERVEQVSSGGGKLWIRAFAYPVNDANGNVREVIVAQEDVTAKVLADAELKQYRDRLEATVAARTKDLAELRQASETQRAREIQLAGILESTADGILAVDANGKVICANRRFIELWRIPTILLERADDQALLAHVVEQLVDPGAFLAKVHALYESNAGDMDILMFKDGRVFERFSAAFMLDGSIIGRVWSFRDITDRRQAEAALVDSRNLLQAIIDTAPMRVFWKDRELRYLGCNPAFARDAGKHDPRELIGKTDFEMAWAEQAERYRSDDQRVMDSGIAQLDFEEPQTTPDGSTIWLRTSKVPLKTASGKAIGLLGIYDDITLRKKADAELEQYRYNLEKLVEERTAALTVAKDAAEVANRAKTAFLANMSHELRTPLNGIMGMTALALSRATDLKQIDFLTKAQNASQSLLAIISDVLDIAKIEADRITLNRAELTLTSVIDRVTTILGPQAEAKRLRITSEIAPDFDNRQLIGDAARLGQILMKLVGNAIKFTEAGAVALRAAPVEDSASSVLMRFEVQDTGIGVSPEDQQRLFVRFEQADASLTRRFGGAGLGLAIARRLAVLMGGDTGLTSAPGVGSTFWFTARFERAGLPAPPGTGHQGEAAEVTLAREHAGAAILLAEDEPLNREVALGMLQAVGLRVDVAEDGRQAIELARENDYAAILMDLKMPRLDGIGATREIRGLPNRTAVPILAMTAHAFADDQAMCLAAGMNDFIAKPVAPEKLFEALLKWLRRTR